MRHSVLACAFDLNAMGYDFPKSLHKCLTSDEFDAMLTDSRATTLNYTLNGLCTLRT